MKIKKFTLWAMMAVATISCGNTYAGSQEREQICLKLGKYVETVVEAREDGRTEKEALSLPTPAKAGTPQGDLYAALRQVISWAYTVKLPPSDSRKFVYTKCLNREFFAYNSKLDD
jgi:hypothetical protein